MECIMRSFLLVALGALVALTAISCSDTRTLLVPDSARFSTDASHTWQAGNGSAWHGYHAPAVTYDAAQNPFELCAQWSDPALFGRDHGRFADTDFFSFDFYQLAEGDDDWRKIGSANSRNKEESACYIVGELDEGTYTFRVTGMARHGKGKATTTHHTIAWQASVAIGEVEQVTFSVTIDPSLSEIEVDGSVQLTATVTDREQNEILSPSLVWTSDDEYVAAVDGNGLVSATGSGYGNVKITATYSYQGADYSGNATVTVRRPPPAVEISAPGDGAEITEGSTIGFAGSATDADGTPLTGGALVWVSSRDGGLGTGESLTVAHLSVGEHEITLTASDAQGLTASARTGVAVVARGGGGGATDMLALPGFQAAWEADSEGMSTHANGVEVSVWSETGGVFDVTAGSADGTKPTYRVEAGNGLPAVYFSAYSQHHFSRSLAAGIPDVATDGLTIYAVVHNDDAATNAQVLRQTIVSQYNTGSSTTQQYWLHRNHGFGTGYLVFAVRTTTGITTLNSPAGSLPHGEWMVISARLKDGQLVTRINGVQVASGLRSGTIQSPGPINSLNIGATHNGINAWGGDQAAVYVYNEGHDGETVAAVEAMLMAKYGLAP
jgi:hypothetical protein